jgi:hypothetical protein
VRHAEAERSTATATRRSLPEITSAPVASDDARGYWALSRYDDGLPADEPVDFVHAVSVPFPLIVLAELMDLAGVLEATFAFG